MRIQQLFSIPALALAVSLGACYAEQTQEGQLPEYEVEQTQEGQLPRYDVEPAEVEVGTDTQVVEVPDVDIRPPSEAERRP